MVEGLIVIAREELALRGARALSFRRLAAAAEVTLATLSYHLGSKSQILQRLVDDECRRDLSRQRAWEERFAALPAWDAGALALLVETYLEEGATDEQRGGARLGEMIWADLVLRAGVDAEIATLLQPWLRQRRDFWSAMFAGRITQAQRWADAVMAYVTDEGVHGLALGGCRDYRMLRRLAVERLSQRLQPGCRTALADPALFSALQQRMDPALGLEAGADSVLMGPGRRREIAVAACEVILEEGAEALTHRAVGERIAMPASTVAYHFRSVRDLLWAGQQMVYLVAQGRMPAPGLDSLERRYRVVMRGTLSISLAAARDPSLVPQAADLRRLRGINLLRILREGGHIHVTALDAQTAALVGLGANALAAAEAEPGVAPGELLEWLTGSLRG